MKNSVYVLPNTIQAVEDFEWLRTEVVALGGEANVFEATTLSGMDQTDIVKAFQEARAQDFLALARDIRALRPKIRKGRPDSAQTKALRAMHERLEDLKRIDFFPSSASKDVAGAMQKLMPSDVPPESGARAPGGRLDSREYQHRVWITRPRPGVDRFSSAWLIRRFIDAGARFVFGATPDQFPDAVPFDMYQNAGFRHEGDRCTFEVLAARFGIEDPVVARLGEIVHDLDLKDTRYNSPHAPTIGRLVDGFRATIASDDELLRQGIALFESLYQSFRSDPTKRTRTKIC